MSLGSRSPAGPASSLSFPYFLSRLPRIAALALTALVMFGTTLGFVTPLHADSDSLETTIASHAPNPVTNLSASNPSDTTVDLSWTLPEQPADVTVTGIQVGTGSYWSSPLATLAADATTYTATTVRSSYSVRVVGTSGYSTETTVRTPPLARLPRAAYKLTRVYSADTSTTVGWSMPEQPPGIEVTSIEIQFQPGVPMSSSLYPNAADAWRTVATIDPDRISGWERNWWGWSYGWHTVTGLEPHTRYMFRVRVITTAGSAYSTSSVTYTRALNFGNNRPRKPNPPNMSCRPSQNILQLDLWHPPQFSTVHVTGVELEQKTGDDPWNRLTRLAPDSTTHKITMVQETSYGFRVRYDTTTGYSEWKECFITEAAVRAGQTGLIPPGYLRALNATATTVDLAWTLTPQTAEVQPTGVRVQRQEADKSWTTLTTLDADASSHTVTGLEPETKYYFRVQLITDKGTANSSDTWVRTKQSAANPVTNLEASNETQTTIDLSWTLPELPEGSYLNSLSVQMLWGSTWRNLSDERSGSFVFPLGPETTSYEVVNLVPGTTYFFRIRSRTNYLPAHAGARGSNGYAHSEVVSAATEPGPTAATDLKASPASTSMSVSWTLPAQPPGVTATGVEVQQQSGAVWSTVAALAAGTTSHTVTGLESRTAYRFRIRVVTSIGDADSETLEARTPGILPLKPAENLAESNATDTTAELSWTLPEQPSGITVTSVLVQQQAVDEAWWSTVATLAADATSHRLTRLAVGTSYDVRVRLVAGSESADSDAISLVAPNPATDLAVNTGTTTAELSWTLSEQPAGVTVIGIEVQRQSGWIRDETWTQTWTRTWTTVETLAADATSHTVTGLESTRYYAFRVRVATAGRSASTPHVAMQTQAIALPAGDLAATGVTATTMDLSWTLPEQPEGVTVNSVRIQEVGYIGRILRPNYIRDLPADATSHTVTGLVPETEYRFRVWLFSTGGRVETPYVSATTQVANPATGLVVSNATRTTVGLAWTLPEQPENVSVTSVEVQQQGMDELWNAVATLAADATTHTVTGLTAGTAYSFRIRLVTANGNADSEPARTQTAQIALKANLTGSALPTQGGRCAMEVSVAFLDTNGNAVAVDALAATNFTVENGSVGTPVAVGSTWTVPVQASTKRRSLLRVRLSATESWEATEFVIYNSGAGVCAPVPRWALVDLFVEDIALFPPFSVGTVTTNYTSTTEDADATVYAQAAYSDATVSITPEDANAQWDEHQVDLPVGESRITITVTPGDGSTAKIYTVTVRRESLDAGLPEASLTQVPSDWSLIPSGLGVGDRFRLLAVTSTTRHARRDNVRIYNQHVQNAVTEGHADIRNHSSYFRVLGCTSEVNARTNTATSWTSSDKGVPVYWLGGDRVADDYADLYDGSWASNEWRDENGDTSSSPEVFTGCNSDGTVGDPLGASLVDIGRPGNASQELNDGSTHTKRRRLRPLYGLSPVFQIKSSDDTLPAAGTLSVADAQAREGTDATLDFVVTLNGSLSDTVTVDYATVDDSAVAGDDYTSTSGTLSFAADETQKTIAVPVLDDAIDEGSETLKLVLSNPSGATTSDAEAVGTIINTDPVQRMWLARLGRTVGSQVVDAVSERLVSPTRSGIKVTLGGQSLDLTRLDDEAALAKTLLGLARMLDGEPERELQADDGPLGTKAWHSRGISALDNPKGDGLLSQGMSGQELLLGSAFYLSNDEGDSGGGLTAWGRISADRFDGQETHTEGPARMDGEVTTAIVGADTSQLNWLAGVAVSLSQGKGKYAYPGADDAAGSVESKLTGVHPYLRVQLSERVQVWGLLGFGSGDMTLRPNGKDPLQTDIRLRLGAMGAKGMLLEAEESGGLDLAFKTDIFTVKTKWDRISNETDTNADSSRLRLAIEGSRRFLRDDGTSLTSALEVGLRNDGGDAETGTGIEVGGRIGWTDPASGLSVETSARVLVAHDDSNYREWGARGSLRLEPGRSGRGLSFSLTPEFGSAAGSVDHLWSLRDANELALGDRSGVKYRLNTEIGYGVPAFGDFTGTPYLGLGLAGDEREWHLGWRLNPAGSPHDFSFEIDAARHESADRDSGHGITLNSVFHW